MPVKPQVSIQTITPKRAQELLDANVHNRRIRVHLVEEYARDMAAGNWDLNGESVKVSDEGELLDGQHRMAAVIQANVKVDMVVVEGLREVVQETMDTGAKRGAHDVLSLRGEANPNILAAVARKAVVYLRSQERDVSAHSNHPTILEIAAAVDNDDLLRGASDFAASHRKAMPVGPSVIGFAYWACARLDPIGAKEFFESVTTGSMLEAGDPALTLRNRLVEMRNHSRGQLDERYALGLIFRARNAFRSGKKISKLQYGRTADFPTPR